MHTHPSQNLNVPLLETVLLVDGLCNLCTASVRFLIHHDSKKLFRYASLQSVSGQKIMRDFKIIQPETPDSLIIIHNSRVFIKSSAWIEIFRLLGGGWKTISIFKMLPVKFRDRIYDWIAKNRYKWFGKRDTCYLPTPETRGLFLD